MRSRNSLEKLALDPVTRTVKGAISRSYAGLAEFEERLEHHLRRLIEVRLDRVAGTMLRVLRLPGWRTPSAASSSPISSMKPSFSAAQELSAR